MLWSLLFTVFGWAFLIGLITYLLPIILVNILPEQNLRIKYDAKWAFVTGASSGLGLSIADRCASQGLNVVLCALDDKFLQDANEKLRKKYPRIIFRVVGCNLGDEKGAYLDTIKQATSDIDVQIIFSNAGFLVMKAFYKTDLNLCMNNFHCNLVSHIKITHHFFGKLVEAKKKGCIVYTSSLVGFLPTPANALYGAAKAGLSQLGACLAIEGAAYGIDVLCVNAGPMNTNFTNSLTKIDMLEMFYKVASTPEQVTTVLMKSVGRIFTRDHSILNIGIRLLLKVIDSNWIIWIISFTQPYTPDWKKYPDLH